MLERLKIQLTTKDYEFVKEAFDLDLKMNEKYGGDHFGSANAILECIPPYEGLKRTDKKKFYVRMKAMIDTLREIEAESEEDAVRISQETEPQTFTVDDMDSWGVEHEFEGEVSE
jgi:hypothetical protein